MWEWIKKLWLSSETDSKLKQPKIVDFKKELIRRIINAYEMGKTTVDYDGIYIYNDGLGNTKQITVSYGLTSSGSLYTFLKEYSRLGAKFSGDFKPYLSLIRNPSIVNNVAFKALLKKAAREDKAYRDLMDDIYYRLYYDPAMKWADLHGLKLPLSRAVIADSFIHSGSILASLRNKFPEPVPSAGGDEKKWVEQYLIARELWLRTHSRKILNGTAVRPRDYLREVRKGNWNLDILPFVANGLKVY